MASPAFEVVVERGVKKDLRRAPDYVLRQFIQALEDLAQDPYRPRPGFDVRLLSGREGLYRLRIGPWRILYWIDESQRTVFVTSAAPRGTAYR